MHDLTPLSGLLGGALIGLAAAMLMLLTGRIAGISGIFGGLLVPGTTDRNWRLAFVAGLIAAPLIATLATGAALAEDNYDVSFNPPIKVIPSATAVYLTPFLAINDSDALVSVSYSGFTGNL